MSLHDAQKERVGCALNSVGGALAGLVFGIVFLGGLALLTALAALIGGGG